MKEELKLLPLAMSYIPESKSFYMTTSLLSKPEVDGSNIVSRVVKNFFSFYKLRKTDLWQMTKSLGEICLKDGILSIVDKYEICRLGESFDGFENSDIFYRLEIVNSNGGARFVNNFFYDLQNLTHFNNKLEFIVMFHKFCYDTDISNIKDFKYIIGIIKSNLPNPKEKGWTPKVVG